MLTAESEGLAGLLSLAPMQGLLGVCGASGLYLCLHPGCILPRELLLNSCRDEDVTGHLQDAAIIGLCFREAYYGAMALE